MGEYNLEEAKQEFIDRNLIPLFDKYNYVTEKLLAQTSEGYLVKISLSKLKTGRTPCIFSSNNLYTIQNIKLWCKLNNKPFELLSEIFENARKKLKWSCFNCNEIFEETWDYIYQNHNCPYCMGKQVGIVE